MDANTAAVIRRNARQLFSLTLRLEIVDVSVELTFVLHPSISPHTPPLLHQLQLSYKLFYAVCQ